MRSVLGWRGVPIAIILVASMGGMPAGVCAQNQERLSTRKFIEDAALGHWKNVREAIRGGMDPDARGTDGRTALMVAAGEGQVAAVRVLLEAGATVDAQSDEGKTAAMRAAASGHNSVLTGLLRSGADPDVVIPDGRQAGWTALIYAARAGEASSVALLISEGADVDHRTNDGHTALSFVVELAGNRRRPREEGYVGVIRTLLDGGADPHALAESNPDLYFEAMEENLPIAQLLIEHGADPNLRDTTSSRFSTTVRTPLGTAIAGRSLSSTTRLPLVRTLLDAGADPNASVDSEGQMPLLLAIEYKKRQIVRLLLNAGADPSIRGEDGKTPLMYAASSRQHKTVHRLLDRGGDVNAQDDRGRTALMYAVDIHQGSSWFLFADPPLRIAEALIAAGADPSIQDDRGNTALDVANATESQDLADLLRFVVYEEASSEASGARDDPSPSTLPRAILNREYTRFRTLLQSDLALDVRFDTTITHQPSRASDVDSITVQNATPLMIATWLGHGLMARRLLEAGANPKASPNGFISPLAGALRAGDLLLARRLLDAGADPSVISNGHPPLVEAAVNSPELVERLIEDGAKVNAREEDGGTALHWGAERGFLDVAQALLDAGAHVDASDEKGYTPLMIAVRQHNLDVVRLLLEAGADPNRQNNAGESVLSMASSWRVERLIRTHIDVESDEVEEVVELYTDVQKPANERQSEKTISDTATVYVEVDTPPTPIEENASLRGRIPYPDPLREAGITGNVLVQFVVDESGTVRDPLILESDHELLSREVLTGLHDMSFVPGKRDGTPVKVRRLMSFSFPDDRP